MDIIEKLRTNWDFDNDDKLIAADEIESLRQQVAEFGKALQKIAVSGSDEGAWIIAYKAIMETMWGDS